MRAAGVILAAGAGSRFGGGKLLARIDGAPILAHVIAAARAAGLEPRVVVVSPGLRDDAVALGLDPDAEVVVNPEPERGVSSSLQLGLTAALAIKPYADAAAILLGDQPLVRPELIRKLVAALDGSRRDVAVPRYADDGARNPVVLRRSAFRMVVEAKRDRGIGPLLNGYADRVLEVPVEGSSPDVDTIGDLARVAELAWASRVRANREQVDRLREAPDGADFYAAVSSIFVEDPNRTGDPVLDALRAHARPDETWLDIGAGAGRYALPLARHVREVVALDPSTSMLAALTDAQAAHAIDNVRVIEARWPAAAGAAGHADVSLIAHVGYDVEAIGPFVEAMEQATRRECLAVMMERSPATLAAPFWPPVHGEQRVALPAMPAFVDLLRARGRSPDVEIVESRPRRWGSRDELEGFVRRQTWTQPGSVKDRRMVELLERWLVETADGSLELAVAEPLTVGVIAWSPR